jgi:hypothetical protein
VRASRHFQRRPVVHCERSGARDDGVRRLRPTHYPSLCLERCFGLLLRDRNAVIGVSRRGHPEPLAGKRLRHPRKRGIGGRSASRCGAPSTRRRRRGRARQGGCWQHRARTTARLTRAPEMPFRSARSRRQSARGARRPWGATKQVCPSLCLPVHACVCGHLGVCALYAPSSFTAGHCEDKCVACGTLYMGRPCWPNRLHH